MKNVLLVIFCLLVSSSFAVNAQAIKNKRELKCYISLTDQQQIVHYFVYEKGQKKQAKESIVGSKVYQDDGVTYLLVSEVFECVKPVSKFVSPIARELEKNTGY